MEMDTMFTVTVTITGCMHVGSGQCFAAQAMYCIVASMAAEAVQLDPSVASPLFPAPVHAFAAVYELSWRLALLARLYLNVACCTCLSCDERLWRSLCTFGHHLESRYSLPWSCIASLDAPG